MLTLKLTCLRSLKLTGSHLYLLIDLHSLRLTLKPIDLHSLKLT